jgi:hypothetical protein
MLHPPERGRERRTPAADKRCARRRVGSLVSSLIRWQTACDELDGGQIGAVPARQQALPYFLVSQPAGKERTRLPSKSSGCARSTATSTRRSRPCETAAKRTNKCSG